MKIGIMSVPHLETHPIKDDYGGIELFTGGLSLELDKLGHEVHLFASKKSYEPPHGELHAVMEPADYNVPHHMYAPLNFEKYMDDEHHRKALIDVDILNDHCLGHPGKALKMFGLRDTYMLTDHCHLPDDRLIYEKLCRCGVSASHAAWCHQVAGTNWKYIFNAMMVDDKQFNPSDREGRLLFFSRMSYSKGPDIAIKIAEAAKMHIDIVGGDRQPSYQWTKKMVQDLCNKSKYAHYVGEVDNATKTEYFRNAACVILPVRTQYRDPELNMDLYWQEPGCMIPIEANACGTPIVAYPQGSLVEYIEDGRTGYFAKTVEEFVAAIPMAMQLNRQYMRKYVEEKFTMARAAKDYVAMYTRLLNGEAW
jgi:glycosyltransferase involved in cell wall biosynthesis